MEGEVKRQLLKKRSVIKGQLTRLNTYVEAYDDSNGNINQIKTRLASLEAIGPRFEQVQSELELVDDENAEDSHRTEFEEMFFNVKSRMQTIIDNFERESETRTQGDNSVATSALSNQVQLPKISLPTFHGNYGEWQTYADTFRSLVHNNASLSAISKFYHLRGSLKGEAFKLISNLPTSEANYEIAWKLLVDRYENKRLIASMHVRGLLQMKPVSKEGANELRLFINNASSNLHALEAMQIEAPLHEIILIQHLASLLDNITRREWETKHNGQEFPSLSDFFAFLEARCQMLETLRPAERENSVSNSKVNETKHKGAKFPRHVNTYLSMTPAECKFCCSKQNHAIFHCPDFLSAEVKKRREFVQRERLCMNCLSNKHFASKCSSGMCRKCNRLHNTLLHEEDMSNTCNTRQIKPRSNESSSSTADNELSTKASYCSFKNNCSSQILLSTAVVNVMDANGQWQPCRLILDSASQSNFITEDLVQRLRLKKTKIHVPLKGINALSAEAKHSAQIRLQSRTSNFNATINCLVLQQITGSMPTQRIECNSWNIPNDIELADPYFNKPGPIDMLIGGEWFFHLLLEDRRTRSNDYPVLQETELGYIVSGRIPTMCSSNNPVTSCFVKIEDNLDHQLKKFWELEEIPLSTKTREEELCEEHFTQHVKRDKAGRFIVNLPRKHDSEALGESYKTATHRFSQLERRLQAQPTLKDAYQAFMNEYEELGHMKEIVLGGTNPDERGRIYYIPHHPVFKPTSTTTKLRVVFDASCTTTNGKSLNDLLLVGPTIQDDLYSIVLRFRLYPVAFTADIEKMYRNILVHEDDRKLQRILWRNSRNEPVRIFELQTLTYGTAPASYLATKCLKSLAEENASIYPEAAKIVQRDFYMDDLLHSSKDVQQALKLQEDLIQLLQKGCFNLRKWISNEPQVVHNVPETLRETQSSVEFGEKHGVKALGLAWIPSTDKLVVLSTFQNKVKSTSQGKYTFSKREVVSIVASIFDPVGLIAPVVISYKIFLQKLWMENLEWDQMLPSSLLNEWKQLMQQLPLITSIQIERCIIKDPKVVDIQLHGFCDSSERAYGAVLYIRSVSEGGDVAVNLVCAKSRVAPTKKLSLPRLELCAAVLLNNLVTKTLTALDVQFNSIHLWTDSTIVLSWMSAPANRWKTFVANRIAQIQEDTETRQWKHIPSKSNPADLVSRGIGPTTLQQSSLWWHGPEFLTTYEWPEQKTFQHTDLPEQRKQGTTSLIIELQEDFMHKYSNLDKLLRVVAYCLRFLYNMKHPSSKRTGTIDATELRTALHICIKIVQSIAYRKEISDLRSEQQQSHKSTIKDLNPFLDAKGFLRVGGRLENSNLAYDNKHQLILPPHHHLTKLIIMSEHMKLLHAAPQLLIAALRMQYWIPRIRQVIKSVIHNCQICYRYHISTQKQLMGQLPKERVTETRPFLHVGVDYAGPFKVKAAPRSKIFTKAYAALFICLATRAVHIEGVSDLTAQAFIASLRRFIARRGRCVSIHSDNGSNFVRANKELRTMFENQSFRQPIEEYAARQGIAWKFIPPGSPHMGSWEGAIKSMKFHLRRVAANAQLTFEELSTLLAQIEACLNSRPITTLSDNPNDPSYLSPGHFLIGSPLTTLPEPSLLDVRFNLLARWQRLQQMTQQIWKRWSADYLNQLQQRKKWTTTEPNLQPGRLVIIKEDNTPPLAWTIGVIEQVHPGMDGLVRVASVRTGNTVLKRTVAKLIPLPQNTW